MTRKIDRKREKKREGERERVKRKKETVMVNLILFCRIFHYQIIFWSSESLSQVAIYKNKNKNVNFKF